jgi:hypothetical protein
VCKHECPSVHKKREGDIHTICKRCKAEAPINRSKAYYNLFLNYLPYTQSYIKSRSSIIFLPTNFGVLACTCVFCVMLYMVCKSMAVCDLHVLRNKRS